MGLPLSSAGLVTILAAVGLVTSCSGPKMVLSDHPVAATENSRALTSSTALAGETRRTLREEKLLKLYRRDSGAATGALAELHDREPTAARRQALAEIVSDTGDLLTAEHPGEAIGHYLDAARLCEQSALASLDREGESLDRTIYDYCAARVARIVHDLGWDGGAPVEARGPLRTYRLDVARGRDDVHPSDFDLLVPVDWIELRGVRLPRVTQEGHGAAMVGYLEGSKGRRTKEPHMPSQGYGFALNASFRFAGSRSTLVLQDLMRDPTARIGGQRVPLAADYTAPLAFIHYERKRGDVRIWAMIHPTKYEAMTGLFSIEPFRDDKIPLVMVHGLLSTAESWLPFANLLRADPVVREKYQLLFFNYPNGQPISQSASQLRKALAEFSRTHDPGGDNPNMRDMVVVGHSMGGILSNMQIRDSGEELRQLMFQPWFEKSRLSPEVVEELKGQLYFEANPDIRRVVFLATPHRGSAFATNPIGRFGAWLIRFPFDLVDGVLGEIEVIDVLTDVAQEASLRPRNSVNSLRPDNPVLPAILELPIGERVTMHSVIASRRTGVPREESSDGLVPYSSSRIEGVASEKYVTGIDHRAMVEGDETIQEMWRILRLHAGVRSGVVVSPTKSRPRPAAPAPARRVRR